MEQATSGVGLMTDEGKTMTGERKWCELCGEYIYSEDEPESDCCYLECPMARVPVRDTGDELGQVLGEALRRAADPPSTPPVKERQ